MKRGIVILTILCVQTCLMLAIGQIVKYSGQLDQYARRACTAPAGQNTVHGIVYNDENSNGNQDASELVYNGAIVYLYADSDSNNTPDGLALDSTVTDSNGEYHFDTTLVFSQSFIYNQRISRSSDDGHEDGGKAGPVDLDHHDVKFGKAGDDPASFRFKGLNLPSGSTIDSAFMYIKNGEDKGGKADQSSVDIYAQDIANPPTLVNQNNNISNRTLTTNNVKFDIDWQSNDVAVTPDLSSIVQELVDSYGNIDSIAFIVQSNGDSDDEIKVVSYDEDINEAAQLSVYYSSLGSGPYYFLSEVNLTSMPAGSVLTTPTYQSAKFYASDVADCNNDFGVNVAESPPIANNDSKSLRENVPTIIYVLINDTDYDGDLDVASVVITENPSFGSITNISASGVITYTPNIGFYGIDNFKYKVSDLAGSQSNEATVNLNVIENLPPVAQDDFESIVEGSAVTISVFDNDSDPNGDLNVFSSSTTGLLQPSNGTVVQLIGNGYNYTPDPGFLGVDQFEYRVCDSSQFTPLCDVALVTVNVECDGFTGGPQNEITGLIFYDQNNNSNHDLVDINFEGVVVHLYNDLDSNGIPDGAPIASTISEADGTFKFDTTLTYSPNFIYNQRIQSNSDDAHEDGGKAGPVDLNNNDVKFGKAGDDPAGFRFTNLNLPSGTTINSAFMYLNNGEDKAGNDISSIDISAHDVASSPTFVNQNDNITSRTRTTNNAKFDFNWDVGDVATSPNLSPIIQEMVNSYGNLDEITFIFDANADSGDEIKVVSRNDDPNEAARLYISAGNGPYYYLTAVELASLPATSVITTIPTIHSATFTAQGIKDCENDFGFYITDTSPNVAPIAVNDFDTTSAAASLTLDVLSNDSDPAGQGIYINSITIPPNHSGTAIINNNGTPFDAFDDFIEFTPSGGYSGNEVFTYEICDNGYPSLCNTASVTIYIEPNLKPIAISDSTNVLDGISKSIAVLANDTDPNGNHTIDPSSVAVITSPSNGSITNIDPITGSITYDANPNYNGVDQFSYVICDFGLPILCDTATVYIDVVSYIPASEIDTFFTGSYIIDMGVIPQTYNNALKPYGLIYELANNQNIPIKWSINPNKENGGVDFTLNGKDYSGGPFIIPNEFRTPAIDAIIATWKAMGVIVDTAVSLFTAPIVSTLTGFNNVVIDASNAALVTPYFANAGIPSSYYTVGGPNDLDACSDLYILPHADPTWATHGDLYEFLTVKKGYLWTSCHAVSMLESLRDPLDHSKQLNFLSSGGLQCYNGTQCGHITEVHANNHTMPYIYDSTHASALVMQWKGDLYNATENGSEQWFIPLSDGAWRSGAVNILKTSDTTNLGAHGTKFIFGYAYDNPDNGMVYYHGGHSLNDSGSEAEQVAGQRALFNFLLTSTRNRDLDFEMRQTVPGCFVQGQTAEVKAEIISGNNPPYTYSWTSTIAGSFDDSTSPTANFTLDNAAEGSGYLVVSITDGCGRTKVESKPINMTRADMNGRGPTCLGAQNGSIDLVVNSTCEPLTYRWNTGETTQDIDSVFAGYHRVLITDALGRETIKTFFLEGVDTFCLGGVLPVELVSFYGENVGKENHLSWLTLSEFNNDYFDVLRSSDAISFEKIGEVDGAGISSAIVQYEFIDKYPYEGMNYYQLKQMDYDGAYEFSNVIDIAVLGADQKASMLLWPNPTDAEMNIDFIGEIAGSEITLKVFNMTGTMIEERILLLTNQSQYILDLSHLPQGVYLVEAWNYYHQFEQKIVVK